MSDTAHPVKAIFLDRDGTLNVEVEAVLQPGDLQLISGVGEAVHRINQAGYWLS